MNKEQEQKWKEEFENLRQENDLIVAREARQYTELNNIKDLLGQREIIISSLIADRKQAQKEIDELKELLIKSHDIILEYDNKYLEDNLELLEKIHKALEEK